MLVLSNEELKDTKGLLTESKMCKSVWMKIANKSDYFLYTLKNQFNRYSIKNDVKELFEFLREESQRGNEIKLVVYDESEILDALEESYKIINVTGDSQYYDFIYRIERQGFLPLMVYRFLSN